MDIAGLPPFVPSNATTSERMHWLQVTFETVQELYNESILRVQRHHLRRAKEARHILTGDNPLHANFMAARTPDGKLRLIDGYTRVTAVLHEGKTAPVLVWLGVADVDNLAEADKLYDAIDSRAAVKRGRDSFEEGLRRANLLGKLTSPAFVKGQVVSAVMVAAGDRDVRRSVYDMRKGIQVLDSIGVRAGKAGLPAGALAALLLIGNQSSKDALGVQKFAAAILAPEAVPEAERPSLTVALACADAIKLRREANALSGKNVEPLMEQVLGYWVQQADNSSSPSPVSRTDFLSRTAAVAAA